MAKVEIPYQPGLTVDDAMEVFRRGFRGKYEVHKTSVIRRDFVVKRNALVGVGVKLKSKPPRETSFVFAHMAPSPILEWLCGGWLVQLVLRRDLKRMEEEVRSFIESAPEFKGTRPAVGVARSSTQDGLQPASCTSCGAPLAGQARFCQTCGTPLPVPEPERRPSCAACGFVLGENARFCQACGTPVPVPEPERLSAASPLLEEGTHCTRCGTLAPQSSLFCHKCGAGVAPANRGNVQIIGAASSPVPEAAIRRGYCQRCGQELGVDEKMRGLAVHKRCAMLASEAPAVAPVTDAAGGDRSAATAPAAPDASVGGSSPTRGHCQRCGQELGVDEKLRGLTVHQSCPTPVVEAPAAAPAQAGQVCCKECGTSMPASSRFCHKCGSAVAADE